MLCSPCCNYNLYQNLHRTHIISTNCQANPLSSYQTKIPIPITPSIFLFWQHIKLSIILALQMFSYNTSGVLWYLSVKLKISLLLHFKSLSCIIFCYSFNQRALKGEIYSPWPLHGKYDRRISCIPAPELNLNSIFKISPHNWNWGNSVKYTN